MMKKNCKKYIILILIVLVLNLLMFNLSYGVFTDANIDSMKGTTGDTLQPIQDTMNIALRIVSVVGSGISIIALMLLGVKYMMGSVEEKAEYKKTLFPYVIGAVFVFGSSVIPGIIYNIFK